LNRIKKTPYSKHHIMAVTNRYSDQDLAEFKAQIEKKLEKANQDLVFTLDQIENITEAMDGEGGRVEETSNTTNLQMLNTMAGRQRHHIRDLENALLRIQSKSYGICSVTGELIDKRRLLAVPTTTKSLAAKNAAAQMEKEKEKVRKPVLMAKSTTPKISSKIIRKSSTPPPPVNHFDEDDDDDDDTFIMEEEFDINSDDLDNQFDD